MAEVSASATTTAGLAPELLASKRTEVVLLAEATASLTGATAGMALELLAEATASLTAALTKATAGLAPTTASSAVGLAPTVQKGVASG